VHEGGGEEVGEAVFEEGALEEGEGKKEEIDERKSEKVLQSSIVDPVIDDGGLVGADRIMGCGGRGK